MIVINTHAKTVLQRLNNRYASQTYQKYYGKSTYRIWQVQIDNIINSLEVTPNKFGQMLTYHSSWGDILYSRFRVQQDIVVIVENFYFNLRILHNWFTRAIYPPTAGTSPPKPTINSINYVRPFRTYRLDNGDMIYAVQSDNHLYSLADKNKDLVINKWFSSLSFPILHEIGELQIIGYGTAKGIPYYIDINLKLHHGAEIAQMQKRKFESIICHITTMIVESLKKKLFLNEEYNFEKLGKWNVVEGSKMLGTHKGLEKWGWLSDLRLYDNNGDAIMVFDLGVGSIIGGKGNKCICAKLVTDKKHKFKHYKALKKDEIPQEILRDLKKKRFM